MPLKREAVKAEDVFHRVFGKVKEFMEYPKHVLRRDGATVTVNSAKEEKAVKESK